MQVATSFGRKTCPAPARRCGTEGRTVKGTRDGREKKVMGTGTGTEGGTSTGRRDEHGGRDGSENGRGNGRANGDENRGEGGGDREPGNLGSGN